MYQISKKTFIRRLTFALLMLAAAFAVNYSSRLAWGGGWAHDNTRYKVPPTGILQVLRPGQTVSPTIGWQWDSETGDPKLRSIAPGGGVAYFRLKLIYPLLQIAFWLALAGAVLALLPIREKLCRLLFVSLSVSIAITVVAAVILFITSSSRALAVLASLKDFGYGGTLGCMLVGIAPLLAAGASGLFLHRFRWFPFLMLLIFNLWVWYQSLLFLVPIGVVLLFIANFLAVSESENSADFAVVG